MASVLMPAIKAPVHEFFMFMSDSWREFLVSVGKLAIDPILSYFIMLVRVLGIKISLVTYYREIFVVFAFYCSNSIRASYDRSRYFNILLSVCLFFLLGTISSLDVSGVIGTSNRFLFSLFAFFIYDTVQAVFDARFHTLSGRTRAQTFIWYFKLQIVWSLLFALISCYAISFLQARSYDGSDLVVYVLMILALGIRNIFAGLLLAATKRSVEKSFREGFLASYIARVGVALVLTVWLAMSIVATGVGAHFVAKYL